MPAKDLVFTVLGIDRASSTFDKVGKKMDRMATVGTKSMAALLGASLGASAGIAAALGGVSVVFGGIAAAALSQNTAVAQSFRDLGQSIKTGVLEDAAPLADTFVGVAEQIGSAFTELRPQLREAFQAAGPHIETLVDGVTLFAREAMPGMVTATRSAGPVMEGLRELLGDTGRATTDFLEVISEGAPEAGDALGSLGDLLQGVLPNIGHMLVNLTELWAEHGDQAVRIVTKLTDVIVDLSSSALPTLSDAFGVALDVLEGVLSVVEPMTGTLGPLIGMWLSLSLAMKGVNAAKGIIDGVGGSVGKMRDSFTKAPGAVGKLSTALGGVMGFLGGPWGLAVMGATAVLALFGQEAEDNAGNQRSLADALIESGGAFDAGARKVLAGSDAFKEIQESTAGAVGSQQEMLDAIIKGGPAYDALIEKVKGLADGTTETEGGWRLASTGVQATTQNLADLRAMVEGATEDFLRENEALAGVASSLAGAKPGADSLAEAMATLGDKTADTASRADALNTAWRRLLGLPVAMEEAEAAFEAGLDNIRTHLDQVKESTDNWRGALLNADGQVNISTEVGRQLSANLITQGDDYRTLAQTVYDTALQRGQTETQATQAVIDATNQRRGQFISEMIQMGFNQTQAEALANRYLGLPSDILTLIRADTTGAQGAIDGLVNTNDGRKVTIRVVTVNDFRSSDGGYSPPHKASGGPVRAGQIYEVGEAGRELFMAPADGKIIPNAATERFLRGMRARSSSGASAAGSDGAAMPMSRFGGGGPTIMEVRSGGSRMDDLLVEALRNAVLVRGGDVQLVLGKRGLR